MQWRRKVPGGAAGLQNQSEGRKVLGGFDSLPSPPPKKQMKALSSAALGALMERSNAKGLAHLALHIVVIAAAGAVYSVAFGTAWMFLAAWAYGTCLVFLFAPLHETVHGTAFRSRWLNRAVSAACGWILVLPPRYFRAFHFEHHRHTQDPERDPELADPPPGGWREYLWRVTGLPYWVSQIPRDGFTCGGTRSRAVDQRVPNEPGSIFEARLFLASYAVVGAVSAGTGNTLAVWCWIVPVLIGQPDAEALPHGRAHGLSELPRHARELADRAHQRAGAFPRVEHAVPCGASRLRRSAVSRPSAHPCRACPAHSQPVAGLRTGSPGTRP